jgi:hypothetical protein
MKRKQQGPLEESDREAELGKTSQVSDVGAVETGSQREAVVWPFDNGLNEDSDDDNSLCAAESTSAEDVSALEAVDEYNELSEIALFSREHRRAIRARNRTLAGIVNETPKKWNAMLNV